MERTLKRLIYIGAALAAVGVVVGAIAVAGDDEFPGWAVAVFWVGVLLMVGSQIIRAVREF